MNCSATSGVENRNFGASIFMITYIGFYGMGLIVYFACQLMTDSKDSHEYEIPTNFFSVFHHINERQNIYNQLINENWVRQTYEIYYSDQPFQSNTIENKVNECLKKYQKKLQNLHSKHTYYVTETSTPSPPLTMTVPFD